MKKALAAIALAVAIVIPLFAQTTADEWVQKGNENFDKGDYANAVTAYTTAISKGSTDVNAYYFRGLSNMNLEKYKEALPDFDKMIKETPDFAGTYYYRGISYFRLGDYDKCIADCDKGMSLDHDFPLFYGLRGDASGAKKDYTAAMAAYQKFLELKPADESMTFLVDKSNPADTLFCAVLFMQRQANRFLGTKEAGKYEKWLTQLTSRTGITQKELDQYVKEGISAVLEYEFNTVHFRVWKPRIQEIYVRRSSQNQYTLNIIDLAYVDGMHPRKTLPAASLEDHAAGLLKSGYEQMDVKDISQASYIIPAMVLRGDTMDIIKSRLTDFFLNPSKSENYDALTDIYYIYHESFFVHRVSQIFTSYTNCLRVLSAALYERVQADANKQQAVKVLKKEQMLP